MCGWEGRPVISILSRHHFLVVPESLQESAHAISRAVYFQGLDWAVPIQGVVGLLEVKKYQEEGVVVYSG